MTISARSVLMAGVATVTASAVAIAPSVQPPPPPAPTIQLAATVQAAAQQPAASSQSCSTHAGAARSLRYRRSLGAPCPDSACDSRSGTGSIGSSITSIYDAVEPWVHYGFEVAHSAWSAGFPMSAGWRRRSGIGYNFGRTHRRQHRLQHRRLARRQRQLRQGLVNFGVDTVDSFIRFGIDEWNFWLPPLPHAAAPPVHLHVSAGDDAGGPDGDAGVGVGNAGSLQALLDRVLTTPSTPTETSTGLSRAALR